MIALHFTDLMQTMQVPLDKTELRSAFKEINKNLPHMIALGVDRMIGHEILTEAYRHNLTISHGWMWINTAEVTTLSLEKILVDGNSVQFRGEFIVSERYIFVSFSLCTRFLCFFKNSGYFAFRMKHSNKPQTNYEVHATLSQTRCC